MPLRYLTDRDYFVIQDVQLNQIIQNNVSRKYQAENTAIEELESYLRQRYDVKQEFTNTGNYTGIGSVYNVGDRVVLDAPAYVTTQAYGNGSIVTYQNKMYQSITSMSPGPFNPTNWILIGNQYDIYYVIPPIDAPVFDIYKLYNLGDKVYWNGFTYICTHQTQPYSTEDLIQFYKYQNVPPYNIFPDDRLANANEQFWGTKTAYTVNTSVQNTSNWFLGDNRSQQMVMYMTDITIYHLHRSIAPQNIPDMRKEAYKYAIKWLEKVTTGEVSANIPVLQPNMGLKFTHGGNTKMGTQWIFLLCIFSSFLQYLIM